MAVGLVVPGGHAIRAVCLLLFGCKSVNMLRPGIRCLATHYTAGGQNGCKAGEMGQHSMTYRVYSLLPAALLALGPRTAARVVRAEDALGAEALDLQNSALVSCGREKQITPTSSSGLVTPWLHLCT